MGTAPSEPGSSQGLWRSHSACKCPLKAAIRTILINCMREAVFCVPYISFKAAACSRRPGGELGSVSLSCEPPTGPQVHLVSLPFQTLRSGFLLT